MGGTTWQVTRRSLRTPAWAVVLGVAVLLVLEAGLRAIGAAGVLLPVGYGLSYPILDLKLSRLATHRFRPGSTSCVILGSSPAHFALDPAAIYEASVEASRAVDCFNLAGPGMHGADIAVLGRVLVEDYAPDIVLYGYSIRDFAGSAPPSLLAEKPWFRQRAGRTNVTGWLVEHSVACRTLLGIRNWMLPPSVVDDLARVQPNGFEPTVRAAAMQESAMLAAPGLVAALVESGLSPVHFGALLDFIERPSPATRAVFLEVPVPRSVFRSLIEPGGAYDRLMSPATAEFADAGALLLRLEPEAVPEEEGFNDPFHINADGARRVSLWLGRTLGECLALRAPQ